MKFAYLTRLSCLVGMAIWGAGSYGLAAQAETPRAAALLAEDSIDTSSIDTPSSASLTLSAPTTAIAGWEGTIAQSSQSAPPVPVNPGSPATGNETAPLPNQTNPGAAPLPSQQPIAPPPPTPAPPIAPSPPATAPTPPPRPSSGISPGRATRSGPSYVGVGGNIGLGDGDTALGEGSFAIFSKIGLTPNISVRPSVLVNDNPTILIPVTFDFIPGITPLTESAARSVGLRVSPFIGAGVAISTGNNGAVDFLATGGIDVPIARRITATAAINASLFSNPAVGLMLGVGYNF